MLEKIFHACFSLFSHPVFLSAFFSWLIAQLLKAVIEFFKKRKKLSRSILVNLLWSTGGMPSSHSSLVTAIATSIAFTEGINSTLFIVSFFYAALTIRDALGVRRAAGYQAKTLNYLAKELNSKLNLTIRPVKEIHGHSMPEVSVGILLGFFIGIAFSVL